MLGNWKLLVKGLLIKERLKKRYSTKVTKHWCNIWITNLKLFKAVWTLEFVPRSEKEQNVSIDFLTEDTI